MDLIRNRSTLDKNNTKTCLQLMPRGLTVEDKVLQASTGGTSSIDGNLKKMNKGHSEAEKMPLEKYGVSKLRADSKESHPGSNIVVTANQINVEKQGKQSQKGSRAGSSKRRDSLVKKAQTLFQSPLLPRLEQSRDYAKGSTENSVLAAHLENEKQIHTRKHSAYGSIATKEPKSVHGANNYGGQGGLHGFGVMHHATGLSSNNGPSKQLNMILNNINLQCNLDLNSSNTR